jgi:hypothetical protein
MMDKKIVQLLVELDALWLKPFVQQYFLSFETLF